MTLLGSAIAVAIWLSVSLFHGASKHSFVKKVVQCVMLDDTSVVDDPETAAI